MHVRKLVFGLMISMAMTISLLSSPIALAQQGGGGGGGGGGSNIPGPTGSGQCFVSTASGAGNWTWGSCAGSSSLAFSSLTSGTNTTATLTMGSGSTFNSLAGSTINFSATDPSAFKLPVIAGASPSVNGNIGYDTTAKNWHVWSNGADNFILVSPAAGTFNANDCVQIGSTTGVITLVDSGAGCGGGNVSNNGTPISGQGAFFVDATHIQGITTTGSGNAVRATTPTFITPILGVATATSINKMAITAPATSSTLAVADGKTATISNTLTFSGTDASSIVFGGGGTVTYTSNNLSIFAATTSAQLATVISDEITTGGLAKSVFAVALQGTDTSLLTSGTVSASTGVVLCTDANHGATTSGCPTVGNTTSTSLTTGFIPAANGANSIINSLLDDGVTTASTLSYSGSGGIATTGGGGAAGFVSIGQGTVQSLGTNSIGLTSPTAVTSYNIAFPSTAQSGYLKLSNSVNQTGCTASSTFLCAQFESNIDLANDVGATILPAGNGGSGSGSLTDHGIAIAHGTSAFTVITCGDGTLVIGHTGANPGCTSTPALGSAGASLTGALNYSGATSGTVTTTVQAAAGTYNFNLPITAGTAGQVLTSQGGGATAMTWTTGGTGTVTSAIIAGTASQITASGTCTITTSGTCTLSLPNAVALGTDSSAAGTMQLSNSAANAHTIWGSGATTTNTINGFATVPTTGDVIDCTVTSTTCLLHDAGFTSANVVRKDAANTGAAAMTLDMSASTSAAALRVPNIAGATSTTAGVISYDTTNKMPHVGANSVDNLIALLPASITPANNDCVKYTVTSSVITLNTAGAACGSGGGGSPGGSAFNILSATTDTGTSATSLLGGAQTIPTGSFITNTPIRIDIGGIYTVPAAYTGTVTVAVFIDGSQIATTGALAIPATAVTNGTWMTSCQLTTYTTGASGTYAFGCPLMLLPSSTATITTNGGSLAISGTTTFDTTVSHTFDLKWTWSTATGSPSVTGQWGTATIGGSPVTSITGDTTIFSNSASTGAVTLTKANAAANTVLGNATGGSAAPTYTTNPSVATVTASGQIAAAGYKDTSAAYLTSAMSQQTSSSCTNVTNMSWNIAANKQYKMHCELPVTFAASATIASCLGGPGTATSYTLTQFLPLTASTMNQYETVNQTSYGTKTTASGAPGAINRVVHVDAEINNGATASGTALTLQTAANGTNGITVLADATCTLTQIGN